jgi:hypothetical protein
MDSLEAIGHRAAAGCLTDAEGRWLVAEVLRLRRRLHLAEAVCWAKISQQTTPTAETAAGEAAAFHAWRTAPCP